MRWRQDRSYICIYETGKDRMHQLPHRFIATGKNIPCLFKTISRIFTANLFQHQWSREGKSVTMLEYAVGDVSPKNYLKCDPCVAPPFHADLVQSGVWWLSRDWNNYMMSTMITKIIPTMFSYPFDMFAITEFFSAGPDVRWNGE